MTTPRVLMLRIGYAGLGLMFLAAAVPDAILIGIVPAFFGAVALTFSRDDVPRWGGLTLLAYIVIMIALFLLGNSISFGANGDRYHIDAIDLGQAVFDDLILIAPFAAAGAAVAAAWERERPVRILLLGALAGFLIVAVLTVVLHPPTPAITDPKDPGYPAAVLAAQQAGATQANLVRALSAVSALAGAAGAFWAAGRPEEFA